VGDGIEVGVEIAVAVGVRVGVLVGTAVGVAVAVGTGVTVGISVGVFTGIKVAAGGGGVAAGSLTVSANILKWVTCATAVEVPKSTSVSKRVQVPLL